MRVLLLFDTHALLWYHLGDAKLSATALSVMDDPTNDRLVSIASLWELAIKVSSGKLVVGESFADFVQHAVCDNGFGVLPVTPEHVAAVTGLPYHHRDPFDRMLVAQALVEAAVVLTCDADIVPYPITRVW